jgi:LysM repeat protein
VNNLKPLITLIVLGGIGYVVYNQVNRKPLTPPPGAPTNWDTAPMVQMPGEGGDNKWGGIGGGMLPPVGASAAAPSLSPPASSAAPTFAAQSTPNAPTANSAAPSYSATANYDTPKPNGQEEKWGTTDPAAAVNSSGAPVASYGDDRATAPHGETTTIGPEADARMSAPTSTDAYASPAGNHDVGKEFQAAWEAAGKLLDQGKLSEALAELSKWYEHPQLSATESQQLTDLLDQLAGTVIYSTQHLLEPAHVVKTGERLEDIGKQYGVPWQLIGKINGIDDPASHQPGEQLKVMRGPFAVQIQIDQKQLTCILNGMYAGRFTIGIGRDMPPRIGSFTVTQKVLNPVYHGRDRTIEADDPGNPLGERWISLGTDLGIHGTGPLTDVSSTNQPGSISLGTRDIDDVYDILSEGSKVVIVR